MRRREFLVAPVLAAGVLRGADFNGWKKHGHGLWTIEDGAFVGRSDPARPGPGYLFTEKEYGDFRLQVEYWVSRRGNSGVYVRQPLRPIGTKGDERPAHGKIAGVEIQIDYRDLKNPTGSVYNLKPSMKVVGREEQWCDYDIECKGNRVWVRLDGELVNDYAPLPLRGAIGFQIHGQEVHDHVVKFRNVRIVG